MKPFRDACDQGRAPIPCHPANACSKMEWRCKSAVLDNTALSKSRISAYPGSDGRPTALANSRTGKQLIGIAWFPLPCGKPQRGKSARPEPATPGAASLQGAAGALRVSGVRFCLAAAGHCLTGDRKGSCGMVHQTWLRKVTTLTRCSCGVKRHSPYVACPTVCGT